MGKVTTVGGLEMHMNMKPTFETRPDVLSHCPFCGHEAGFRNGAPRGERDHHRMYVMCSNGSCAIRTPEHYADERTAAIAWNRRPTVV